MERSLKFNSKDTFISWDLILTALDITPPEPKTYLVNIDGMDGSIDLSEALTGNVAYNDRTITASFWTDKNNRDYRERLYREVVASLHGRRVFIQEPDDPEHYFIGRVIVGAKVSNLSFMEFSISATCEPWRYNHFDTVRIADLSECNGITIYNQGLKVLSPTIEVEGEIILNYSGTTIHLTNGKHIITDLKLTPGENYIGLEGTGTVTFIYKEATL